MGSLETVRAEVTLNTVTCRLPLDALLAPFPFGYHALDSSFSPSPCSLILSSTV